MRRVALSVVTACGLALLAGCGSSGGTGFGGTGGDRNLDQIVFTNGNENQAPNDFELAPVPLAPLNVTAQGQRGTGAGAVLVADAVFLWDARFAGPTSSYSVGVAPSSIRHLCPEIPAVPAAAAAVPLLTSAAQSSIAGGFRGYADLLPGQATNQVWVAPVRGVPAPYCLLVNAHNAQGSGTGSVVVIVSNSP